MARPIRLIVVISGGKFGSLEPVLGRRGCDAFSEFIEPSSFHHFRLALKIS